MRFIFALILAAALLLAGCGAPAAPKSPAVVKNTSNGTDIAVEPIEVAINGTDFAANQTEPPAPPHPPEPGGSGIQEECATMTPNCGTCTAKAGCGWCKTSNGCFVGDASGPAGDIRCQPADWAVTEQGCQAPSSPQGTTCAEQIGCGNCLSGDGCKFCRQGAVCADVSSADGCFGGWLTDFYQCAAGSQ